MAENIDTSQLQAALEELSNSLRSSQIKLANEIDSTAGKIRAFGIATGTTGAVVDKGLDKIASKSQNAALGLELVGSAAKGFYQATMEMTKALYDGQRGAQVTAKALGTLGTEITSTAKGIGLALMLIPGLGIASRIAGAAVTALSFGAEKLNEVFQKAAEQNDKVFDSFNQLSQSGLGAKEGMDAVFNNLQSMKMTTAELDKFNYLLASNSKELKLFGVTAGEGAANFAKTAGELFTQFNTELGMLGVTQEEQRRSTLNFMAQQARMGNTQKDLVNGTKKYIEELDRLATLTGASRQEQEEARNLILQQEELRAAMLIAEQEGDTKRAKELENFLKLSAALATAGDRRGAMGAAQFAAAGGIAGEESAAFERTYRGAIQAIQSGKTTEEALVAGAQSAKELLSDMAQTKRFGGDVSALLTGSFAQLVDFVKSMEKAGQSGNIKDLLESLQRQRTEGSGDTRANVELRASQQQTAMEMDRLLKEYIRLSPDFYKGIQQKFEDFVKSLREIIQGLRNRTNPGQTTPPGQFNEVTPGGAVTGNPRISQQAESSRRQQGQAATPGGNATPAPGGNATPASRPQSSASPTSFFRFTENTGSESNFNQLDPNFRNAVINAATEYNTLTGKQIQVNSSFRSREDQQRLYDESVAAGRPGKTASGMPVARPGGSDHERGMAIDIQNYNDAKAVEAFNKSGLFQRVQGDPVHFSFRNGGIVAGPETGFPATLHGREAIIPLASNSLLEKLATTPASEIQNASSSTQENQILTLLTNKFDQMIEKISDGVYIQDQILKYSRA